MAPRRRARATPKTTITSLPTELVSRIVELSTPAPSWAGRLPLALEPSPLAHPRLPAVPRASASPSLIETGGGGGGGGGSGESQWVLPGVAAQRHLALRGRHRLGLELEDLHRALHARPLWGSTSPINPEPVPRGPSPLRTSASRGPRGLAHQHGQPGRRTSTGS